MSVPPTKRKQGQLAVFTKIDAFCKRIQTFVESDKYFPADKTQQRGGKEVLNVVKPVLAKNIYTETLAIRNYAERANKVYVKTKADYELRHELLNRAIAEICPLAQDLETAMKECNIDGDLIFSFAVGLDEIKDLLQKWKNRESTFLG